MRQGLDGYSCPLSSAMGIATLIILNKEMNDIMKIVRALEDSGILQKGVTETIKNETKKGGFLTILSLGTLGARFVGNLLSQKGMLRAGYGKGMVRAVMEIK